MFPTDQQKRLLAVNSSNPSLRSVAAPFSLQGGNFSLQGVNNTAGPQLSSNMRLGPVQIARPDGLQVGNQTIQQNGGNTSNPGMQPRENPFIAGLRTIGGGVEGAAVQTAKLPLQFSLDYSQAFGNLGTRLAGGKQQNTQQFYSGTPGATPAINWSGATGKNSQLAGDAAQVALLAGGGAIGKAGEAIGNPVASRLLGNSAPGLVNFGSKLVGGTIAGVPTGSAYNVAAAASNGQLTKKNALGVAGQGAALGALFGGPLDAGLSAASSGIKRVFGTPSEQNQFVNYLSKEKDPNAIHDTLAHIYGGTSDAIKQAAVDIAHSPNKQFIIKRLADLPEEGAVVGVGGELVKDAIQTQTEKTLKAHEAAQQRIKQERQPKETEINFGSVDPNILPPDHVDGIRSASFTPEEQQLVDQLPHPPSKTPSVSALSKNATNSFENAKTGVKPGGIARAAGEIDNGSAQPIRYRVTPEGQTVIEDGRHRLEAARQAGIEDFPAQDVTDSYSGGKAPGTKARNMRQFEYTDTPMTEGEKQALADLEGHQVNTDYAAASNELRKLANESGQTDLYKKVMATISAHNMSQAEATNFIKQGLDQMRSSGTNAKIRMGVKEPTPSVTPEQQAIAAQAQAAPQAPALGTPEGAANSVETQPGGLAEAINNSADQNITKLPTEMPKHTNALQRTFLSVSGELSKMGDAGQAIANKLKAMRDTSETGQAWFIKQIPSVLKLKGKDFTDFVDTLDGLSKGGSLDNVPPKIAQAVQEWTAAIPQVRDVAHGVGVDVGDLGPHYFPRNYTELLKNQAGMNKVANDLVKSGQAANVGEALQQLRFMKRQYFTKFGHFENSRKFDLPGYDKSRNALISYVEGAFNKIGHAEQFGPKGEQASQLVAQLGSQGHDVERASRLLKIANGTEEYNQPGVETTSRAIRAFNRTTKLGLSAILNAGQTVNTAAAGGVTRTLKNIGKFASKNDQDFVDATGVNADSVLSNLREQTGISGKITSKITAPGFNAIERFNRGTAALVGRDTANMLAEKAAQGNTRAAESLSKGFGIDEVPPDGVLNPSQQIQAARNFVERTQFKVDPQDLPAWANSPLGKMAAQFRTFSYKQQKFIQDEVLKQAIKGNVQPLVRFIAVGAPVGLATSTIRGALRGQPATQVKGNQDNPTKSSIGKFVDALNNAGGFGMGSSALFPVQNVKSARFPQYLASSVLGPTAGLAVQTATNVQQAAAGSPKAAERQGISAVPVAGPFIANKTIPYKPSASALAKSGDTSNDTKSGFANFVDSQNAQKTTTKDFVKTLSPQDRQYFQVTKNGKTISVSQSMLDAAHAAGQLNDQQYRYATSLHDVYDRTNAQGKASKQPANLDPMAKQYYDLTGKLDKQTVDDFKKGRNNNPVLTRMANQVADTLNKQLPTGIKGVKPSPQLLDAYAKFQKSQAQAAQDGQPWDDLTARTKLKGFWSTAIKGSQDQRVQEIYKQSSTQLKDYFIKNKKVSTDDVMKAIGLDDALFNADLIDSPHFSKTFRKAFGVGMPNAYTTGGSGGSGGGSGSGTGQYVNIDGKNYQVTAEGTPVKVTGSDGLTKIVRVNAQGLSSGSTGLSSLVPSNLSFKTPAIDTTPQKVSFKVKLPEDVRGNPRPQRVASTRYTTVRVK